MEASREATGPHRSAREGSITGPAGGLGEDRRGVLGRHGLKKISRCASTLKLEDSGLVQMLAARVGLLTLADGAGWTRRVKSDGAVRLFAPG